MVENRPFSEQGTITVAASDTVDKSGARFICDGSNDHVTINNAIAALPAGGGTVVLLEGNYTLGNGSVGMVSNIQFIGQGYNTIITQPNDALAINIPGISNSTIRNLKVKRTAGYATAILFDSSPSYITIENCHIEHTLSNAIDAFSGSYLDIINNIIIGANAGFNNENGAITNCKIIGNTLSGAAPGIGIGVAASQHNLISGNRSELGVAGSYNTITEHIGPMTVEGNNNIIQGNDCAYPNGTSANAIEVSGNYNTIDGNSCHDSGGRGIYINGGDYNTITNNVCENNGTDGILLYGNSIHNTVTGNVCEGNADVGILLESDGANHPNFNTVTGNVCEGNAKDGIMLYKADGCVVSNNLLNDNSYSGIILLDTANNNNVIGNLCINNGGAASPYGQDGITLHTNCDNNVIAENKCYDDQGTKTQDYGINVISVTCNNNIIHDNDLLGNDLGAMNDAGTGTIYFSPEQNIAMDLLVEDTNHVVAAEPINVGTPIPCVIAAQIAKPRNITITITDGDVSISAFQIDIVGINTKGEAATEQFLFAGGLVQVGNVAWAHITSITVTSITGAGAGDVLDVGIGSKLGITGSLYIGADVYHVVKNTLDWPAVNYTVDLTYDTVDISTGGAINAGDDATIFFRASRNRIK